MVDPGHDSFETGFDDRIERILVIDGDHDPTGLSVARAQRHLDDHRQAADVGERFAGEACRSHSRGYENECFAEIVAIHA